MTLAWGVEMVSVLQYMYAQYLQILHSATKQTDYIRNLRGSIIYF